MESEANSQKELTIEDKEHILMVFHDEIMPKLTKLGARLGTLNCDFAGNQYSNWNVQFKSAGSDFEIVEFEYDEEGVGMDLDL